MNEEYKNIETCLAEDVLSEVANVPTDPQFVSLVEESFDPLQQQALQQAGYEGYENVVWTHKPYTFTSQVKQMKSNLILLLRRLWRFPFGRGTTAASDAGTTAASAAGSAAGSASAPIRSLADMWQHYITRLQGNPEYSIPSRLSSLTDLPDAPALLADRKICGVPEAQDGISLVHLLNDISAITELTDDNTGWTMDKALNTTFPNLEKIQLGCSLIPSDSIGTMISSAKITKIEFTNLVTMYNQGKDRIPTFNVPNAELYFQSLVNLYAGTMYNSKLGYIAEAKAVIAPKLSNVNNGTVANSSNIKKMVFGKVEKWYNYTGNEGHFQFGRNCPNLIHVELGEGSAVSISMPAWSPTNALDASRTDLIEEGSTATNNLQQFLSNARQYIMLRLAQRISTTSLTLTLSPEVYKAVYGLDADYNVDPNALAQTASLADFGINTEDLNEIEISAGITTATKYATWLDTYRGAIYWNIQHS